MNRNRLFTELNKLCNEMDFKYNTCCGGCCFVTACLAENLERYNIPFKVAKIFHPCHYFIKVSDRYINRCDFTIRAENIELFNYNSDNLYDIYYDETWNSRYNRKWNLIISTRINSVFKKYANSRT